MRALGFASRRRCRAGVAMMASPSQLTPRTRIFSCAFFCGAGLVEVRGAGEGMGGGSGFAKFVELRGNWFFRRALELLRLPAFVDPEPIGRVPADGGFEGPVHIGHDLLEIGRASCRERV